MIYHPISDWTITKKSDHTSITSIYHPMSDWTITKKSDHTSITVRYHPLSDWTVEMDLNKVPYYGIKT